VVIQRVNTFSCLCLGSDRERLLSYWSVLIHTRRIGNGWAVLGRTNTVPLFEARSGHGCMSALFVLCCSVSAEELGRTSLSRKKEVLPNV
jgi:hypothetical protein